MFDPYIHFQEVSVKIALPPSAKRSALKGKNLPPLRTMAFMTTLLEWLFIFHRVKQRTLRFVPGWVTAMLDFVDGDRHAWLRGRPGKTLHFVAVVRWAMRSPLSPDPVSRDGYAGIGTPTPKRGMGSFHVSAGWGGGECWWLWAKLREKGEKCNGIGTLVHRAFLQTCCEIRLLWLTDWLLNITLSNVQSGWWPRSLTSWKKW